MSKRRLVIDSDCGLDDLMAIGNLLLYLDQCPDYYEVSLISSVHGMTDPHTGKLMFDLVFGDLLHAISGRDNSSNMVVEGCEVGWIAALREKENKKIGILSILEESWGGDYRRDYYDLFSKQMKKECFPKDQTSDLSHLPLSLSDAHHHSMKSIVDLRARSHEEQRHEMKFDEYTDKDIITQHLLHAYRNLFVDGVNSDEKDSDASFDLLCLGPLTNIATLLKADPSLFNDGRLHRVVIMGGNFLVPGNTTIGTETNFALDACALDYFLQNLSSKVDVVIFGLEVANEVNGDLLHFDFTSFLSSIPSLSASPLIEAKIQLSVFLEELVKLRPHCRHYDTVVSVYLLHPELFDLQEMEICVDSSVYSGKMLVDDQCADIDVSKRRTVKLAIGARL